MTEAELSEAVGLLARYKHRWELKLLPSEIYYIRRKLEDLGVKLDPPPNPVVA